MKKSVSPVFDAPHKMQDHGRRDPLVIRKPQSEDKGMYVFLVASKVVRSHSLLTSLDRGGSQRSLFSNVNFFPYLVLRP